MSDYRIVETEFASGRVQFTVEIWRPTIAGPGGTWETLAIPVPDKQAAVDYVAQAKTAKLDTVVVRTVELDDKGKAK